MKPEQPTPRKFLRMTEGVKTVKVPVLLSKEPCGCGTRLELQVTEDQHRKAWASGTEVQLDCPKCGAHYRSSRQMIEEGTPQAFAQALQGAVGAQVIDRKLRGKVNGS